MDVEVRHGFAGVGAVVDHEAEAVVELEFFRDLAGDEEQVAEDRLIFRGGFADARDRFFGDDEQVDRRLRLDVVEDDAAVVLVFDAAGYFAGDDAFEERGHG